MMSHSLRSHMKFHQLTLLPSLLIFWAIVAIVMVLSILVNAMTDVSVGLMVSVTRDGRTEAVSVVAAAFIAVLIYTVVISLVTQPENFSFLIGLGSSRRAFFIAQVIAVTTVSMINGFVHSLAFALESIILPLAGLQQLDYLQVYGFQLDFFTLAPLQGMVLMLVASVFMFIAAAFYRFRSRNALIALIAGVLFSLVLPRSLGVPPWRLFYQWLMDNATVGELSWKLMLMTMFFWGLAWQVIKGTEAR